MFPFIINSPTFFQSCCTILPFCIATINTWELILFYNLFNICCQCSGFWPFSEGRSNIVLIFNSLMMWYGACFHMLICYLPSVDLWWGVLCFIVVSHTRSPFLCLIKDLAIFFFSFLVPHLWHMEVPRPGVKLELQLPAYPTAIAMQYLNRVCDQHHGSWKCWILHPLSKARDWAHILMDTNQVHNLLSHSENSLTHF